LLVIIFGSILFLFSRHAKFEQKVETEEEEASTMNELYRKIITEEMDAMEAASKNILDEPLFVDYRLSDDTLKVVTNLKLKGKKIVNPVFEIKTHGRTVFSKSFSSDTEGVHCKGVMEEGSLKFFIYYCSENQAGFL
jgi:hypothetical protein